MNSIVIKCDADLRSNIFSIIGVFPDDEGDIEVEPGFWSIPAEATDVAIGEIEGLGGSVDIIMNNEEFEQHISDFYDAVAADATGIV